MSANVTTTREYTGVNVLTFADLKDARIGLVEARRMAAQAWQDFENDAAAEEERKPARVTAKTNRCSDWASFAICEDGELSEIEVVMVEDCYGDIIAELAHFVIADYL